jgi:hypothetical protein
MWETIYLAGMMHPSRIDTYECQDCGSTQDHEYRPVYNVFPPACSMCGGDDLDVIASKPSNTGDEMAGFGESDDASDSF